MLVKHPRLGIIPFDDSRPSFLALKMMIDYTLKKENIPENIMQLKNKKAILKEYLTISFRLPRQSGSSTSIKYLCETMFKNPCVFVYKQTMSKFYDNVKHVYSFNSVNTLKEKNRGLENFEFDVVFVDLYTFTNKTFIDELYNFIVSVVSTDTYPLIVLVD